VNQNPSSSLSLNIHKSPNGIAFSHIPSKSQKVLQEKKLNPTLHMMNQRSTIPTQILDGNKLQTQNLEHQPHPKTYFPNSSSVTFETMPIRNYSQTP
jgi:hypothetical protein